MLLFHPRGLFLWAEFLEVVLLTELKVRNLLFKKIILENFKQNFKAGRIISWTLVCPPPSFRNYQSGPVLFHQNPLYLPRQSPAPLDYFEASPHTSCYFFCKYFSTFLKEGGSFQKDHRNAIITPKTTVNFSSSSSNTSSVFRCSHWSHKVFLQLDQDPNKIHKLHLVDVALKLCWI